MILEISKTDAELLDAALTCYEKEAVYSAMTGSMLGLMLSSEDSRDEMKAAMTKSMHEAELEGKQRRRRCTLLRARLIRAEARASEHALEDDGPVTITAATTTGRSEVEK
jgi:hypothetical protein